MTTSSPEARASANTYVTRYHCVHSDSTGSATHTRPIISFAVFWALGFLLPLLISYAQRTLQFTIPSALAGCALLYASFRLAWVASIGAPRLLTLTFWVFSYVWLGLVPLVQLLAGEFPWPATYDRATLDLSFAVILVGFIAFDVGSRFSRRSAWSDRICSSFASSRFLSLPRVKLLSVASLVASLAVIYLLGGFGILAGSRHEVTTRIAELTLGPGLVKMQMTLKLLHVPPFIASLLLLCVILENRRLRRPSSRFIYWLFAASLALNIVVNNPVNTPRYWVGTIVFSFAFLVLPWNRRFSFAAWAIVLILLLALIFPYADMFRYTLDVDMEALQAKNSQALIYKLDYDGYQQLIHSVLHVREHGVAWGRQLLGALLFWVPRASWPGKPLPSNELVAGGAGYEYTNVAMPLWAEAYLDGGIVGVALILFGYGCFVGVLERLYLLAPVSPANWIRIFVPVYAAYQMLVLRGALMIAIAYFAPVIVMVLLATRNQANPRSSSTQDKA
jgi:oligosaccharide repeat unit polymerase